jgi:kynureninase
MVAAASLEQMAAIGVARIQAHNRALTGRLVAVAREEGWRLLTPAEAERRGGTVCIGFERAAEVAGRLGEAGIWVDWRPGFGVRFSPHVYVEEVGVEKTIEVLRGVVGKK